MVHICCLVRTDFCSCVIANLSSGMRLLLKKWHKQVIKNIKNVTRCRDSRTAKSKETRQGRSHKTVKCTNPLHIFFHYTRIMEKDPCRGLYTFNGFHYLFNFRQELSHRPSDRSSWESCIIYKLTYMNLQ